MAGFYAAKKQAEIPKSEEISFLLNKRGTQMAKSVSKAIAFASDPQKRM